MRILLDTVVLLWSVAEEQNLNSRAAELIRAKGSALYFSAASVWEIAIKYALGKLPLHVEPEEFIPAAVAGLGIETLDITPAHAVAAGKLPKHHEDPFDRMLIAQANAEGLVLLTADRIFEKYKVPYVYGRR
jgi:PIN domain nuclease of toxin-antitoxin system